MKTTFVVKVRQGAEGEITGEFPDIGDAREFVGLVMENFENAAIMVSSIKMVDEDEPLHA